MLTKGKFQRVTVDLFKQDYHELQRFLGSSIPRWIMADFVRMAVNEKLAKEKGVAKAGAKV